MTIQSLVSLQILERAAILVWDQSSLQLLMAFPGSGRDWHWKYSHRLLLSLIAVRLIEGESSTHEKARVLKIWWMFVHGKLIQETETSTGYEGRPQEWIPASFPPSWHCEQRLECSLKYYNLELSSQRPPFRVTLRLAPQRAGRKHSRHCTNEQLFTNVWYYSTKDTAEITRAATLTMVYSGWLCMSYPTCRRSRKLTLACLISNQYKQKTLRSFQML